MSAWAEVSMGGGGGIIMVHSFNKMPVGSVFFLPAVLYNVQQHLLQHAEQRRVCGAFDSLRHLQLDGKLLHGFISVYKQRLPERCSLNA